MSLPYENTTAGDKALGEIQKMLRGFGCTKFGTMVDDNEGTLLVQFEHHGQPVSVKASSRGYAAAWLREHPYNSNYKYGRAKHEERALNVASVAVYSILRDWIKGQLMAIETGILTFEGAFTGQLLIPGTGKTVLEHLQDKKILKLEAGND